MSDNRITIHVDMDYFFAQCEEREHPGRILILLRNFKYQDTQYPNMETAGILRARERHER